MKVSELIKQLSDLNPELEVYVEGYEGGYDSPVISDVKKFKLNFYKDWYYGSHEERKDGDVEGIILQKPDKR
jgi:hypothetical protein